MDSHQPRGLQTLGLTVKKTILRWTLGLAVTSLVVPAQRRKALGTTQGRRCTGSARRAQASQKGRPSTFERRPPEVQRPSDGGRTRHKRSTALPRQRISERQSERQSEPFSTDLTSFSASVLSSGSSCGSRALIARSLTTTQEPRLRRLLTAAPYAFRPQVWVSSYSGAFVTRTQLRLPVPSRRTQKEPGQRPPLSGSSHLTIC
jgi:hypothetical protein